MEISNYDSNNIFNDIGQSAAKNLNNETKTTDEFKIFFYEDENIDPIKRNLKELLNMLNKDNYEEVKNKIFDAINEKIEYQEKFLDILFQKLNRGESFLKLYAKLCKELDKNLKQRNQPKEDKKDGVKKKSTSIMRTKLIDKCREIFQIKNIETFNKFFKINDQIERENEIKKLILCNISFIAELINIQILSKKIAPQCINNLFDRYENNKNDEKLKLINLEAIILLTNKFGKLINQNQKIKPEDQKIFKENIEEIVKKLEKIKEKQGIPNNILYSIENLIEKKKNNWNLPKSEKYIEENTKNEIDKQFEEQDIITQDIINNKIKIDLIKYKDFIKKEGNSSNYSWEIITDLYEDKGQKLGDILEGYIIGCSEFIINNKNIKYAKQYIREIFDYYKVKSKEKKSLINKIIGLFPMVSNLSLINPDIYIIYSYVFFIFIDVGIMRVKDLEKLVSADSKEDDIKVISIILKKICKLMNDKDKFIDIISGFRFVQNNIELFEWTNGNIEPEEEEKEEKDEK